MKKFSFVFFFLFLLIFTPHVFAESSYVLPYPSFMPGSPFYKINLIKDEVLKYWYFGNFGQFKYNQKLADKYLVEAKTLFEYRQYLQASISLKESDEHFKKTLQFLLKAEEENKNIEENRELLSKAAEKHIEILKKLSEELPEKFEWRPEKGGFTIIFIKNDLEKSIFIRSKYL